MAEFKLIKEIIDRSESRDWDVAKKEWDLMEVYFEDEPETCLCGHYPIIELCELRNRINERIVIVGNCCVKKFLGLPSDNIFQAIKRIKKDIGKSLNSDTIWHAFQKNWINEWEYEFYTDTFRKKKLTEKQILKRRQINEKVLNAMQKNKSKL